MTAQIITLYKRSPEPTMAELIECMECEVTAFQCAALLAAKRPSKGVTSLATAALDSLEDFIAVARTKIGRLQ